MTVGCITPPPPPSTVPRVRKPRPDDPVSRRPPILELSRNLSTTKRRRVDLADDMGDEPQAKRGKSDKTIDLLSLMARERRYKLRTGSMTNTKGKARMRASNQSPVFKVPHLPAHVLGNRDAISISASPSPSKAADPNDIEVSNKIVCGDVYISNQLPGF